MLSVYHLGVSQSDRIVWLCEELGVEYQLVRFERDAATRLAPADYKALHPLGTAPVIDDDGVRLAESGAIVDYLLARHDPERRLSLAHPDPAFPDYLFWLHFANGSFMPRGMATMVASRMGAGAGGMLDERRERAFAITEERLTAADHFAGDRFTAADIMMVFPLTTMRLFAPFDLTSYPAIRSYLQRIAARAAFATAMNKADPDLPLLLS